MSEVLEQVLKANARYAESFGDKSRLALPPARRFAILTCMDARLIRPSMPGSRKETLMSSATRAAGPVMTPYDHWSFHTSCSARANGSSSITRTAAWSCSATKSCGICSPAVWRRRAFDGKDWRDTGSGPGSTEGQFVDWLTIKDQSKSVVADVMRIRNHPLVPRGIPIYGFHLQRGNGKTGRGSRGNESGQGPIDRAVLIATKRTTLSALLRSALLSAPGNAEKSGTAPPPWPSRDAQSDQPDALSGDSCAPRDPRPRPETRFR